MYISLFLFFFLIRAFLIRPILHNRFRSPAHVEIPIENVLLSVGGMEISYYRSMVVNKHLEGTGNFSGWSNVSSCWVVLKTLPLGLVLIRSVQ